MTLAPVMATPSIRSCCQPRLHAGRAGSDRAAALHEVPHQLRSGLSGATVVRSMARLRTRSTALVRKPTPGPAVSPAGDGEAYRRELVIGARVITTTRLLLVFSPSFPP
jgi:hypothetical protein